MRREQDDIVARPGKPAGPGGLAQNALGPVAHDGTAKTFCSNEGDPPRIAFVHGFACNHTHQGMLEAFTLMEDALEIQSRLNRPHARRIVLVIANGKTLAALGATTGEHGTAALGGHTGAEAVGLGALTLVRLVRTLHG